jgi:hypothetical protein
LKLLYQEDGMSDVIACQAAALRWISGQIERHRLPYQIVGGLAAIAHGSRRPLHDIDIYMPLGDAAEAFIEDVAGHVNWGPRAVIEGPWDITYMKLTHGGQKIEIGDSRAPRIRDRGTGAWIEQRIDFEASVICEVLACRVPVMPRDQLIAYKRVLDREVDRSDIRALLGD